MKLLLAEGGGLQIGIGLIVAIIWVVAQVVGAINTKKKKTPIIQRSDTGRSTGPGEVGDAGLNRPRVQQGQRPGRGMASRDRLEGGNRAGGRGSNVPTPSGRVAHEPARQPPQRPKNQPKNQQKQPVRVGQQPAAENLSGRRSNNRQPPVQQPPMKKQERSSAARRQQELPELALPPALQKPDARSSARRPITTGQKQDRAANTEADVPTKASDRKPNRKQRLNSILRPKNLRKEFILTEVFQPPVALREPGTAFFQ